MVYGLLVGWLLALATALPLAWKWQLGAARAALATSALAVAGALVVASIGSAIAIGAVAAAVAVWLATVVLTLGLVAQRFYRDPDRTPPARHDVVVSPADGEVVYVREAGGGLLPVSTKHGRPYALEELTKTSLRSGDAVVVGIALNFLDVHVNRAPLAGRVTVLRHFPGLFGSLRRPEMVFENERATMVIERDDLQVAVVMIASRLVRRIVTFVREGQDVALGQRIGVIRFGSQVDLVLPARGDLKVTVAPGDRVVAGESLVAVLAGTAERVGDPGPAAREESAADGRGDYRMPAPSR